jgi:uncharacterized phage protein (TIGR01671 family)
MRPKFRAWGVERDPGLKQPAPKMHRNVSVVTTYTEGITFVLTDFNMWGDDEYSGSIIDDAILMQSTDMVDRNGKIIFEGDIVKMAKDVYSEPTYYEVVRHRGGAYRLESKQHGCELWLRHTDCEVVGNVYENKELLDA